MKTAIILTGICRNTLLTKDTWKLLPFEADWFLTTWDVTKSTYSDTFTSSEEEIEKIKTQFKKILITPYIPYFKEYMSGNRFGVFFNTFYLLDKIKNELIDNYDRFIVTRSDLYLKKLSDVDDDFFVDEKTAKILGMYSPVDFINHNNKNCSDVFLCMDKHAFKKYSNFEYMLTTYKNNRLSNDIHKIVYDFFSSNNISLETIDSFRAVLVRDSAEEYYSKNKKIDFETMTSLFVETYVEKDVRFGGGGKFPTLFNYVRKINDEVIVNTITKSQSTGGILKKRNK